MQKIDEVEGEPIIGQIYSVRTIKCPSIHPTELYPIPVLSDKHKDDDFDGLQYWHYHVDFRFCNEQLMAYYEDRKKKGSEFFGKEMVLGEMIHQELGGPPMEMFWGNWLCVRKMPEYPALPEFERPDICRASSRLEQRHFGKLSMNPTLMRCPHQGVCLRNVRREGKMVVCPGHGLAFDVDSGKMIKRYGNQSS